MLMGTANDLGFPGVSFPSLSIESPQVSSTACYREARASNIAAIVSEVMANSAAPGIRLTGGKKRTAKSSPWVPHHSHTLQTEAGETSNDSETLCLWLRGQRSSGKASHWPAERCTPPVSSICSGMKGLGFSLEGSSIFSSICQALGTPKHFIKH